MANENASSLTLATNVNLYKNIAQPRYSKPIELGAFSLDDNGSFIDSRTSLKYFLSKSHENVKRKKFDLNIGFEHSETEADKSESYILSMDNLLRWIVAHKREIVEKDAKRLWCEFVCWRGLLTRVLTTVFENHEDWVIAVSLFHGTYYLCEYESEKRHQDRLHPQPRQALMSYWGRKFEHYCVTTEPGGMADDPFEAVSMKEQFCSIVTSKLDDQKLLFGGEVDCCDPVNHSRYIELKTNRIFTHRRQEENFYRFKALKWWAQSFLIGIGEIVAGFRDDGGFVQHLQTFQVRELPRMSWSMGGAWDPGTAFTFTHRLLTFIKDKVTVDDPKAVCLLRFHSAESRITAEYHPAPSSWTFLPDWYIEDIDTYFTSSYHD